MNETKLFTRRGFISFVGKFSLISATLAVVSRFMIGEAEVKARRPPGAVPEEFFSVLCVRCGRCAEVCPMNIIKLLPLSYGLRNFNTPILIPKGVCIRDLACIDACPSGALQKITIEEFDVGTAIINEDRCTNCGLCMYSCREIVNAIKWTTPEKKKVYIDPEICIGCGACILDCPNDAISVTGEKARRTTLRL